MENYPANEITIIEGERHSIGDNTTTTICRFKPKVVTIEDAISYIVKEKSIEEKWEIIVKNTKDEIIASFSYNKWIITWQNGDLPEQTKVKLTRSNGWWWFMDYDLVVVE